MKFIGQYIQSFIARFRNDVYLEDVSTGTIASGGNLGLDSNNKIVKATVSSGSGDIEGVEAGTGLSGGGDTGTVTLNVSGLTVSEIAAGSILVAGETFADNDTSLMSAAAINDRIESFGYTTNTGDITSVIGGTNCAVSGGTSGDATVNVPNASTSVRGVVELATTAETTTGTDANRVVTPDGLKDGYQGSTNVTTLGTIGTGDWRGTAIAQAYIAGDAINGDKIADDAVDSEHYTDGSIDTAHIADDAVTEDKLANTLLAEIDANTAKNTNRAYFEFKGYGSSDGTNYEMPEIISDNNAPFEHNTSTGSNGLTAQAVTVVMRQGGVVMPYTGTLKKFTGWVTTQGTGTVDVGIFKFTPVDNNADPVTPALLVNEQITGAGNTKMRSFSETSSFDAGFTAGDVIYSAVLGSGSGKSWYLNSTLEVEWT